MLNFSIDYQENCAIVYINESLAIRYSFDLKKIFIISLGGSEVYDMKNPPVDCHTLILPTWKQVLLGMSNYDMHLVLDMHRDFINFENKVNEKGLYGKSLNNNPYKKKKTNAEKLYETPKTNVSFVQSNPFLSLLRYLVIESDFNGEKITFVLNIEEKKIYVMCNGSNMKYYLKEFPKKYFKYLIPNDIGSKIVKYCNDMQVNAPHYNLPFNYYELGVVWTDFYNIVYTTYSEGISDYDF